MTEISIPSRETQRQIEGQLPEAKIFDLLSSVGNGENKALELTIMREGVVYSDNALYQEVMIHQEKNRRWEMSRNLPFDHCQDTLSPIGLVAREALSLDDIAWGYEITGYGLRTGKPFAGLLLKWSHEHPQHSLYKMFSSTQSPTIKDEQTLGKKRAQETRYKIFWEIVTNHNNRIRLIDIADAINENPAKIGIHLKSLSKNGVVSYEVSTLGQSSSYFRRKEVVPDGEPKQYRREKMLSTRVDDLLTHEYASIEEVGTTLIQKYHGYKNIDRIYLNKTIASLLSDFERQGYVERKKFDNRFRSELTLSEQQREAILSLVTLIDKFKNGDGENLEEGKRFAQRIQSDPNLFSELMLKAKEASPSANRTNAEDMHAYLISMLSAYPNSTVKQILQVLEKDYDKIITHPGIHHHLSALVREGKIALEKTKAGNIYRVVDDAEN